MHFNSYSRVLGCLRLLNDNEPLPMVSTISKRIKLNPQILNIPISPLFML